MAVPVAQCCYRKYYAAFSICVAAVLLSPVCPMAAARRMPHRTLQRATDSGTDGIQGIEDARAPVALPLCQRGALHTCFGAPNVTQYLAGQAARLIASCRLRAADGTTLFTPDGSSSYGAQWTRDFAYMLENAGSVGWNDSEAGLVADAIRYTFHGQRADGCMPDRVQADGTAVYSPGAASAPFADHAIDNGPFSAKLLIAYMKRFFNVTPEASTSLFCSLEPSVRRALSFAQQRNGMIWNDPAAPNCTYGFTDTVAKQGNILFCSLLYVDAAAGMGEWSERLGCGNATVYAANSTAMSAAVSSSSLFNASRGLFNACSEGANALPDIWGSALAVHLGVATAAQSVQIVQALAAGGTDVFQDGQVRHLPAPLLWGKCFGGGCPAPGTYQNGAFWATPLSWVVPALSASGHPQVATALLNDTAASFQSRGVMECISGTYHGVVDYVDSATNAFSAALG